MEGHIYFIFPLKDVYFLNNIRLLNSGCIQNILIFSFAGTSQIPLTSSYPIEKKDHKWYVGNFCPFHLQNCHSHFKVGQIALSRTAYPRLSGGVLAENTVNCFLLCYLFAPLLAEGFCLSSFSTRKFLCVFLSIHLFMF